MEEKKLLSGKGVQVLLIILVAIMLSVVGVLWSKLSDERKESAEVQELLEGQRAALESDLSQLRTEFGELQTNNDSMRLLAADQQVRIDEILKVQADNYQKIRMYQKELSSLREVLKSYIAQVDSLNTRNIQLTAEKRELSSQLAIERDQTQQLTQERAQLTTAVEKAQVLMISPITTVGLTSRSSETPRASRIEKMRSCFTVRANQIAPAGERVFYLVVKLPNGRVLTNAASDVFYADAQELIFTARRVIDYDNRDVEVCIFCDANDQLVSGVYTVEVYTEGYRVGDATFELR